MFSTPCDVSRWHFYSQFNQNRKIIRKIKNSREGFVCSQIEQQLLYCKQYLILFLKNILIRLFDGILLFTVYFVYKPLNRYVRAVIVVIVAVRLKEHSEYCNQIPVLSSSPCFVMEILHAPLNSWKKRFCVFHTKQKSVSTNLYI